jgi:hypothetical protein
MPECDERWYARIPRYILFRRRDTGVFWDFRHRILKGSSNHSFFTRVDLMLRIISRVSGCLVTNFSSGKLIA